MDLPDLLHSLRRRWPIIAAGVLIGATAAGAHLALATPTYDATARLYITVAAAENGSATDLVQGGNAAEQRVRSYVDIVTTPRVLQHAIDALGLEMSAQDLADEVRADSPNETVLLNVTVRDTSAARAAELANAISTSFTELVTDDLEVGTRNAVSPVSVRTVQPAIAPDHAATPQTLKSGLLGVGGGLALGLLIAVLRDLLDTRIRGRAEVETVTERPILGVIPKHKSVQHTPVYVQGDRQGQLAEAFRSLRTNLRFVEHPGTPQVFVVTSANASEGKTTTALNLAAALIEGGSRVAVVDCDLRRPAVAGRVDMENATGLTDVLTGRAELEDVLQPWGATGAVLPAGPTPPNPGDLLASAAMTEVLRILSGDHDYVIIDTPPLLPVTDAAILASATAGALLVTAAGKSHTHELRDALEVLDRVGARTLGIAVSMVKPSRRRDRYEYLRTADATTAPSTVVRRPRIAD
ncbi:capsular exopolysaccharide synthesis family protein [Curtobacterium flaccumfaciens]|uniref:non-specific protein-tyrosine kinase n=1 Tax=Curtobacterium salicis TaxID=1779862 RepID=A0ABX0T630_9MICO|nr:polysaccharide biosynthesis tyrosine autokinase [Curtobacterium sp. WW7]NII40931.1 capsular exopolysaccharide synthesis family protein [Curtobacterium sp. WW7]